MPCFEGRNLSISHNKEKNKKRQRILDWIMDKRGFPRWLSGKKSTFQAEDMDSAWVEKAGRLKSLRLQRILGTI